MDTPSERSIWERPGDFAWLLAPSALPKLTTFPPPPPLPPVFGLPEAWTDAGAPPPAPAPPMLRPLELVIYDRSLGWVTLGYSPGVDLSQPIALVLDDRKLGPVTIGWIMPGEVTDPHATTIPLTFHSEPLPGHQSLHRPEAAAVVKAGYGATEGGDGSGGASTDDEHPSVDAGSFRRRGGRGGASEPEIKAAVERFRREHEPASGNNPPATGRPPSAGNITQPEAQAFITVPPVQLAMTKIPEDHETGLEGPDYSGTGGGSGGVLQGPLGPPGAPRLTENPGEIVKPISRPPSGGSPALRGDPYHPDTVAGRLQRPIYESSPPHGRQLQPGKTPEPADAATAFENGAVRAKNSHTWYSRGLNGQIYRYQESNDGKVHFNAIIDPRKIPRGTFSE